jgi:hypothetical protein
MAEALEREYASTLDEHTAELAYHLAQSSEPRALARAIEFCAVAARRAFQIYAFSVACGCSRTRSRSTHRLHPPITPDV